MRIPDVRWNDVVMQVQFQWNPQYSKRDTLFDLPYGGKGLRGGGVYKKLDLKVGRSIFLIAKCINKVVNCLLYLMLSNKSQM